MRESKSRRYDRLTGPDLAADIRDEIEFHLQVLTDKHLARGLSADAARAQATIEFGDMTRAREACMAIGESQERINRRAELLGNLWQDLRHGGRRLVKNPGFTIVTVLTLAIGLGPNIAIFNIINSVLLKPLPYKEPGQLMVLQETFQFAGGNGSGSVSGANFVDWKTQNRTFSQMAIAGFNGSANLGDPAQPERLSVSTIDANVFPMLSVTPMRGRLFREDETRENGPKVVILSETFWRRKYLGDESVLGSRVTIDGAPHEVIGIMPARIIFPNRSAALDAWLPFQSSLTNRGNHAHRVYGRLKPGISRDAALADLKAVAKRIEMENPQAQEGRSVIMTPLSDVVMASAKDQLLIFLGAAALVLLIACANGAGLMLARAAGRRREVAVLAALGASRGRVVQQFLVEALLISALAAGVGFVLAIFSVKGILVSAGNMVPRTTEIHFDGRVIVFVGATIILTALICGLAPAVSATQTDLQTNLRQGGRSGTASTRFRSGLVAGQFALSLVLLVGAGLLLRTFAALMGTATGFRGERVITMHLPVPIGSERYPTGQEAVARFHKPLLDNLRGTAEVEAAAIISQIPLQQTGFNANFAVVGRTYANSREQPFAEIRAVSPGYFNAMGVPIRAGRDLSESDAPDGETVIVVNEEFVKRYFKGENPIGRRVAWPGAIDPKENPGFPIVGVAASVKQQGIDREAAPEIYFSYRQRNYGMQDAGLVVRTRNDPKAVTNLVRAAVKRLDPIQPIYNVKTMREIASDSVSDRRLYMRLLAGFAAVALMLAMAGIYGVISFAVTQRTREFGIRLALGSETSRISRMVVKDGARLALIGLVIGLPAAFLTTRLIASVLYGVERSDPVTYIGVAAILGAVAIVASYVPARRAVKVDPIIAMRAE